MLKKGINMKKLMLLLGVVLSFQLYAQSGDTILLTQKTVYFDFAKDDIRNDQQNILDDISNSFTDDFNGYIKMSGHTDAIGTNQNNDQLSERRINSVIVYLAQKGMPRIPFISSYEGENTPIADNDSDQGRQLNRRVEIKVYQVNTIPIEEVQIIEEVIEEEPIVEEVVEEIVPISKPPKPQTTINFKVKNKENSNPLTKATITYQLGEKILEKDVPVNNNGEFLFIFNIDEKIAYDFSFYAEGFFHVTENIEVLIGEAQEFEIYLEPIKKGTKLVLKNLYFYGNQAKLLPKSIPELERVRKSLELNKTAIVEIQGHINYPRTKPKDVPEWSINLAKRRAEVIYEYMVENGIDPNRIRHKGYGNTQMVYPNAVSEEHQAANRRVEMKVIGYTK